MNLKFKFSKLLFAVSSLFLVAGCKNKDAFKRYEAFKNENPQLEDLVVAKNDNGDTTAIKYANYDDSYALNLVSEPVSLGRSGEVLKKHRNRKFLNSTGEAKLIVVPVDFEDYTCEDLGVKKDIYIENLNKVFFGVNKNNSYLSVAEYFNRSSYGNVQLSGRVCDDFYRFPKSKAELIQIEEEKKNDARKEVELIYNDLYSWYQNKYGDIDEYKIDGLNEKDVAFYLVYTCESENKKELNNFFWAYTFPSTPLSWSSYSFMFLDYGKPDGHTYIHEVGHLFGLNDYYPTLSNSKDQPEPTARIDMMDCSIGDETGFSKMFLEWANPIYVKDSCELNIKSFQNAGDLILLNDNWNKTVFDEYYLLEFYTPTGLNTFDVNAGNSEAKLPSLPGIKLYHVDARLAYFETRGAVIDYCSNGGKADPNGENIDFAHDNNTYTSSPNDFEKNYLYELILNNANDVDYVYATDINLFHAGDVISNLSFNSGGKLNYKIKIKSTTFKESVITIEKEN